MVQPDREPYNRYATTFDHPNCDRRLRRQGPFVVALCNDGTAWKLMHDDRWAALPRIPQGEAPDVGSRKGAIKWGRPRG
jgi:hypothetical protein